MTADTAELHSPLGHFAGRFAAATHRTGGALRLAELPHLSQVSLRLDPKSPAADAAGRALGLPLPLPLEPNTFARSGTRSVLWLGPDEWLVVGPPHTRAALESRLRDALQDHPSSVVDVSAQRTTVLVAGPQARDLLAHGCALDLHPRSPAGRCAQTLLARIPVVLVPRHRTKPGFWVLARASFAGHLAEWLLDAATEQLEGFPGGR